MSSIRAQVCSLLMALVIEILTAQEQTGSVKATRSYTGEAATSTTSTEPVHETEGPTYQMTTYLSAPLTITERLVRPNTPTPSQIQSSTGKA
ncbi:hypothetical protein F4775DRAFT_545639 [Biscogniauxia sp. FL1348]|nr:hypothetical protein F4775DRAFT_545639 [Biscogniauxia sp. FL1348]